MNSAKKYLYFVCLFFLTAGLSACGSGRVVLADDVFLCMSSTAQGNDVEIAGQYTLHTEIHRDGTVRIYADNFSCWFSSEEIPEETVSLSADTIQEICSIIEEIDLYHMRENISSQDLTEGEYMELTVFTTDGEHTTGGLSPSNRSFRKLYDYVEEQTREAAYQYRSEIAELQNKGQEQQEKKGISITDTKDQELISKDMVSDVCVTYGPEHEILEQASQTDAADNSSMYYVTIVLTETGAQRMQEETAGCSEDSALNFKIYMSDTYVLTFYISSPVLNHEVYIYETNDAEKAATMAEQYRNNL